MVDSCGKERGRGIPSVCMNRFLLFDYTARQMHPLLGKTGGVCEDFSSCPTTTNY